MANQEENNDFNLNLYNNNNKNPPNNKIRQIRTVCDKMYSKLKNSEKNQDKKNNNIINNI